MIASTLEGLKANNYNFEEGPFIPTTMPLRFDFFKVGYPKASLPILKLEQNGSSRKRKSFKESAIFHDVEEEKEVLAKDNNEHTHTKRTPAW